MIKSMRDLRRGLDTLVLRGEIVATLDDDGDVSYRDQQHATEQHRRNQLSVEEVRRLRRSALRLERGEGVLIICRVFVINRRVIVWNRTQKVCYTGVSHESKTNTNGRESCARTRLKC